MSGIERLHLEDAYEDCPQVNANIFKTFSLQVSVKMRYTCRLYLLLH